MPRSKQLKPAFAIAPRPVQARSMRTHGLFGVTYVRQHMMYDDNWSPSSLTDQFRCMADLLSKRLIFSKLETKATYRKNVQEAFMLRHKVRDGRAKLANVLHGQDSSQIRNFLMNHKDMQRLYQNMPVHLVDENIDQRTFVMRKERDRLATRLDQLKIKYQNTLMERAKIENRMKYENEFVLDEEIKARHFRKKIEDSKVRLSAIKTINTTYRKMIQVLNHDTSFYEPIIYSLQSDVENQAVFIKHILYLGVPADAKFQVLNEEYRQMEDKSRRSMAARMTNMTQARGAKIGTGRYLANIKQHEMGEETFTKEQVTQDKRYVRETFSMQLLKNQLEAIESTIKQVKYATLCSRSKEIFPRFRSQTENNFKLEKLVTHNDHGFDTIYTKKIRSEVLEEVLMNNLTQEEIRRSARIKELNDAIAEENERERILLEYMKNRADAHVTLRYSLWNLNEILRHVGRHSKASYKGYPHQYLKLPLLKFDMLNMHAVVPEHFEETVEIILRHVKRKINQLMDRVKLTRGVVSERKLQTHVEEYQDIFAETIALAAVDETSKEVDVMKEDDLLQKVLFVPSRHQIKTASARIVEELSKKEVD